MKRVYLIISFLLLFPFQSFTQVKPGARQIGLSNSGIALDADAFSLFNNPSCLADVNLNTVALYYSPSPFGLKELSNAYGTLVYNSHFATFSSGFMVYGFELYKETKLSLGFGKAVSKDFSIGLTAEYKNLLIKNYGQKGYIFLNMGGLAKLSKDINFGFTIDNFTRTSIKNYVNQFPVVISGGFSFHISDDLQVFPALVKELGYQLSFRAGAELNIIKYFQLRFGISDNPKLFSGGVGISYNNFTFDYAVISHPMLDYTHQFGLIFSF